ncbi:CBS domain-containing protein [Nitrospina sp. 32_T5]|uniref:CBS domain-containing protein n=1 Tax=unclassified Nitrospina TaxID=2638683 RepID=UPI003F9AEF6F
MTDILEEVGNFMSSPVLRIDSDASVQDAAILMEQSHVGSLIIEQYGEDIGILTERDFTQKVLSKGKNPEEIKAAEIMSSPIKSMDRFMPIEEANRYMQKNKIRHLGITDDDKIVGILSIKDLVGYYSKDFKVREDY